MGWFSGRKGFVAGFLAASLLFGGFAAAADLVQRDIRVSYLPLKYLFNNQEKTPPADQQGFTHNGRTYVPLRFMAESLGQPVDYDPATYSIFVGRRPQPLPEIWQGTRIEGDATLKPEYFPTGVITVDGEPMPDSLLLTSMAMNQVDPLKTDDRTYFIREIERIPAHKSLKGTLFVSNDYFGDLTDREIGYVVVMNELNQQLFKTNVLTTRGVKVPIDVNFGLAQRIKIYVALYHNHGTPKGESMLWSQVGISNLRFE